MQLVAFSKILNVVRISTVLVILITITCYINNFPRKLKVKCCWMFSCLGLRMETIWRQEQTIVMMALSTAVVIVPHVLGTKLTIKSITVQQFVMFFSMWSSLNVSLLLDASSPQWMLLFMIVLPSLPLHTVSVSLSTTSHLKWVLMNLYLFGKFFWYTILVQYLMYPPPLSSPYSHRNVQF